MKKRFSRIWIVFLTFTLSVAATLFWFRYFPIPESYESVDFAKVPSVEYCELKNDPHKYNGKIIRLETTLYWFMHGFYFADDNCRQDESDSAKTAISFYEPRREIIWNKLEQLREKGKRWEPVKIKTVGRFSYKYRLGGSDSIEDRTHLQFEIYEIESATR